MMLSVVDSSNASWLSDITGVDINVPAGTITFGPPRPDRIPMMLQNLPKDAAIFLANPLAGGSLAFAIRQAKTSARRNCVPIPATVTSVLSAFFPPDLFAGVCWAVVANGFTLDSFAIHDAGMSAITLEDVVVFASSNYAYDPILWSHELTHVQQYQSLGVEGFAALYSVAWDALEQQARDFDQFVARSLQGAAAASQRYYVISNGWNMRKPIPVQQYAMYARQSIDPRQCAHFQQAWTHSDIGPPAYLEVVNNCPVEITVTSFQFRNTQTSALTQAPCPSDCGIAPSKTSKWPVQADEITQDVSYAWPVADLCQSGTFKEPGSAITWTLTFTAQGLIGSRTDGACAIELAKGKPGWYGSMRCNNGASYRVVMQAHDNCRKITSDIGWLKFER